ncbi:MAG: hypothetical protein JJU36_02290 [Phycisphaeraceae bacterium]|nr:hypothetical protein [Phycisphaeraceae bacterium]
MDTIKRYWHQIQQQAGQLDGKSRVLIGSFVVILLLVGFLLIQYAASPDMESISSFIGDQRPQAASRLKDAGIPVRVQGDQIMVPSDRRLEALALLANDQLLAADTASAFDDYVRSQNLWRSNPQDERSFLLAKQSFLSQTVRSMKGVRTASVVIDRPRNEGFSRTHQLPTASAIVTLDSGARMDREFVSAVANLIAGAVAGMRAVDVQVIDAGNNISRTVESEDDLLSTHALGVAAALEARYQEKLSQTLRYIPGVIIAVNVQVDSEIRRQEEGYEYLEEPVRASEMTVMESRGSSRDAGEPGARSNVGASIGGGGGTTTEETREQTERRFQNLQLTRRTASQHGGGRARQVNVTVNIPRGYFVTLFRAQNPEEERPSDEALEPIVTRELASIESQVRTLIATENHEGTVFTAMVPDGTLLAAAEPVQAGAVESLLDSGWVTTAALGLLAALSLGLMFSMVRKATQQPPIPTAEELAGIPPTLHSDEDLVGEADEVDQSMSGVELDEGELRTRKIAGQIGDMIRSNPTEAAGIFNRWLRTDAA